MVWTTLVYSREDERKINATPGRSPVTEEFVGHYEARTEALANAFPTAVLR